MIHYKSLEHVDELEILETHNSAFSDYEVQMNWTLPQFQNINKQRGVRYDLSMGAFDDDKLVGFIINGTGDWNNKPTVYDCGTGIIKDYRHKGIGTEILLRLIKLLRDLGISQYLLEVIKSNENAYQLLLLLREHDLQVATAESLTAGLMFSTLVDIPFSGWNKSIIFKARIRNYSSI